MGDMTMGQIVLEQDVQDSFQQQHIKAMFDQLFCEIYIESPINSIIEGYRNQVRVCPVLFLLPLFFFVFNDTPSIAEDYLPCAWKVFTQHD